MATNVSKSKNEATTLPTAILFHRIGTFCLFLIAMIVIPLLKRDRKEEKLDKEEEGVSVLAYAWSENILLDRNPASHPADIA